MNLALAVFAACVLAALLLIWWQLRLVMRLLAALRAEVRQLGRSADLRPSPQPPPGEPPSEVFRSGLLEPPPASANPALTSIAKPRQPEVVGTKEMARLVERFKDPKA